ncbi:CPBP family intramembrane glutamic endopeptidase [Actinomadura sp. NTSP31]|uniref:CPBP family intramembrane glutamic endopeptidase n=1 Tax=Actinomadura sp. NTSP31 TaxID=1735447 RepID=UPI0035C002F7
MSPLRQAAAYLGLTYALALTVALLFPHKGFAPPLTVFAPVIAVALTITFTSRRGERRRAWAGVGWRTTPRALLLALVLPAAIAALSYGTAVAVGVARYSTDGITLGSALDLVIGDLLIGTLFIMGEEIGWRGFLLPLLATALPRGRAWLVTGALHACFHLPLLLLTTTYQSEGNRLIVVPMVLVTITLAGVVYGWLREISGGVWAVSVMHNAFNTFFETLATSAVVGSAATLAYVTTETGVATLLIVAAVAAFLVKRTRPPVTAAPLPGPVPPVAEPIG